MDRGELANVLMRAHVAHRKRKLYSLDAELLDEKIVELHNYGVFNTAAIAELLDTSRYRVNKAIDDAGLERSHERGTLNPVHLEMLMHGLASDNLPTRWLEDMVEDGTSLAMINRLTNISIGRLRRRLEDVD